MANETTITVVGNLTADPELRVTPVGFRGREFSPWRRHRASTTSRARNGRTATRCFCGAPSGGSLRKNLAESLT